MSVRREYCSDPIKYSDYGNKKTTIHNFATSND